ncbi:hypothetical protein GQ600_15393 [Phytophthora cactorum]|nr:hypothetical protein GQ600_15393 [Phytophthora cactorum]
MTRSRRLQRLGKTFSIPFTQRLTPPTADDYRPVQEVRNHWSCISRDVSKFVGCCRAVKTRNQSGKNADDILNDTRTLFPAQEGFSFAFETCWQILRKS